MVYGGDEPGAGSEEQGVRTYTPRSVLHAPCFRAPRIGFDPIPSVRQTDVQCHYTNAAKYPIRESNPKLHGVNVTRYHFTNRALAATGGIGPPTTGSEPVALPLRYVATIFDDSATNDLVCQHLLALIRASVGRPRPIGIAAVNRGSRCRTATFSFKGCRAEPLHQSPVVVSRKV